MQMLDFLNVARINAVMQGLQDPRLLPQQLVWDQRIPDVPALDEEIMARFVGTVLIADLVADDQKAAVYSQGRMQLESTKIPNLKIGQTLNQTLLNQLMRLAQGVGSVGDNSMFPVRESTILENILLGIRQRKEALKIGMLIDGYSYDRLGIKMSNVTWGMPSDLKVTPSTPWTNTASTPITDINTLRRTARIRYGINLNRLTMSTAAFQLVQATTEFQTQAKIFGFGLAGLPAPAIPLQADATLQQILQRILGDMTLELYDARYWTQDTQTGVISSAAFLPLNKVILTDSGNDGNSAAMDFANGVVTESVVANLAPVNIVGRFPAEARGPIGYAEGSLNPPNITYWGVARGFPRKHLLQSSAVLTVGTVVDTISTQVPFE